MGRKPAFDLEDAKIIGKSPETNQNLAKLTKHTVQTIEKYRNIGKYANEIDDLKNQLQQLDNAYRQVVVENTLLKSGVVNSTQKPLQKIQALIPIKKKKK